MAWYCNKYAAQDEHGMVCYVLDDTVLLFGVALGNNIFKQHGKCFAWQ
jgi:hypothetical protein